MSYQALYRTWRPQRFVEVVGQAHVVRTLQNAVQADRVAHAYLFCGPRGTGKTTIAKVLAKAINCTQRAGVEPCGACASCISVTAGNAMDVLEIDAASSRGVDEIRELREKVKFGPATGNFKVYIVDEVHMLTREAFNALLKTLEEPPGHVIFVLATTEPHKLPLTIISRCQRFDFRRITKQDLIARLEEVAARAGLVAEPGVFTLIARVADGSLRDALGILDQAAALGENRIELDDLNGILGTVTEEVLERLVHSLMSGEAGAALLLLQEVEAEGKELRIFAREITDYLRGLLYGAFRGEAPASVPDGPACAMHADRPNLDRERLVELLTLFARAEQELRFATRQILPLELAVVGFIQGRPKPGTGGDPDPDPDPDPEGEGALECQRIWSGLLAEFRRRNPPAAPWLARAEPVFTVLTDSRQLRLNFSNELAKEKIALPENKVILEEILNRFQPGRWQIMCVVGDNSGKP